MNATGYIYHTADFTCLNCDALNDITNEIRLPWGSMYFTVECINCSEEITITGLIGQI